MAIDACEIRLWDDYASEGPDSSVHRLSRSTARECGDVHRQFRRSSAEAIGNDFASQLKSALGEAAGDPLLYAAAGSSLILSGPATVDFWYLGSESRYSDYFALSTDGIGYLYRGEGAVALSYSRGIDGLDGGYFGDSAKYIGAMTYASGGSFNSGGALQRLIAFRSASPAASPRCPAATASPSSCPAAPSAAPAMTRSISASTTSRRIPTMIMTIMSSSPGSGHSSSSPRCRNRQAGR